MHADQQAGGYLYLPANQVAWAPGVTLVAIADKQIYRDDREREMKKSRENNEGK